MHVDSYSITLPPSVAVAPCFYHLYVCYVHARMAAAPDVQHPDGC
jgi:hypothetical protein